ncbi:MAG: hypothetical protein IKP10_06490 [Clostridia bacterium]|nr:hypothetical protein [Clostridia bacterium]
MKIRRLWLTVCAALLLSAAALADGPVGGHRGIELKPKALTPRSAYTVVADKTEYEAGETITFTAAIPEGGSFILTLCVLDGSYENEYMADTLWQPPETAGTQLTYDLAWVPGNYVFFYTVFDADGAQVNSTYGTFLVRQCGGTNELDRTVAEIVRASRGADDFETLVNLHDWVLDHCEYDYSFTYYSAESLFFLGTGVCNSYTRAFDLLLREAGIPSRRVSGCKDETKPDETGHAWNAAALDGQWYLYDLTWDDVGGGFYKYQYCGLTNELMDLEHRRAWYVGGAVNCTSLDSNYFVRSGVWPDYMPDIVDQIEARLAAGGHRFALDPADDCLIVDEISRYIFRSVAAACFSSVPWTDAFGDSCEGTFTARDDTEIITGRLIGEGTLILPADTETVGAEAFAQTTANYVVIGGACTGIGDGAFRDSKVWEITMGSRVTGIGEHAFEGLPNVLIIAPAGSYAANWALNNGFETAEE